MNDDMRIMRLMLINKLQKKRRKKNYLYTLSKLYVYLMGGGRDEDDVRDKANGKLALKR